MEVSDWLVLLNIFITGGLGVAMLKQTKMITNLTSELDQKKKISVEVAKDKRSILKRVSILMDQYIDSIVILNYIDPFADLEPKYNNLRKSIFKTLGELELYTSNKKLKLPFYQLLILENKWSSKLAEYYWEREDLISDFDMKQSGGAENIVLNESKEKINTLYSKIEKDKRESYIVHSEKILSEIRKIIREMNYESEQLQNKKL